MASSKLKICLTCEQIYPARYTFCIKDGAALTPSQESGMEDILEFISVEEICTHAKTLFPAERLRHEFALTIEHTDSRLMRKKIMELCHQRIPDELEAFVWRTSDRYRIEYLNLAGVDLPGLMHKPWKELIFQNDDVYFCYLRNVHDRRVTITGAQFSPLPVPVTHKALYYYYVLKKQYRLSDEEKALIQSFPDKEFKLLLTTAKTSAVSNIMTLQTPRSATGGIRAT